MPMGVVISVTSAPGGVGKTTMALLLAYFLFRYRLARPGELLLVDLDPTAGLSLRLLGDDGYYDVCRKEKTLLHMYLHRSAGRNVSIRDYVSPPLEDVTVLRGAAVLPPGENESMTLNSVLGHWFNSEGPYYLKLLLERAGIDAYNFVVVDSAPFFDERYTQMAVRLGRPVVPLKPTVMDLLRTIKMIKTLQQVIDIRPIFVFNFDKDKYVREAAALRQAGVEVPKSKQAKPNERVYKYVEELKALGYVVSHALPYYKKLSDTEFPYSSLGDDEEVALCPVVVEILAQYGIAPTGTNCPAEVEEG